MTKTDDAHLEAMLRHSKIETANNEMAERIIAASERLKQKTPPLRFGLRNIFVELHIAQPIYVLSFTLLLGVVIGFASTKLNYAHYSNIETQIDYLDNFLYGDVMESNYDRH